MHPTTLLTEAHHRTAEDRWRSELARERAQRRAVRRTARRDALSAWARATLMPRPAVTPVCCPA